MPRKSVSSGQFPLQAARMSGEDFADRTQGAFTGRQQLVAQQPDATGAIVSGATDVLANVLYGEPDLKARLLNGYKVGKTTYMADLDRYDQTDLLTGMDPSGREGFYCMTETTRRGLRYGDDEWQEDRSWLIAPAVRQLASFVASFKAVPPRTKSFDADIDEIMRQVTPPPAGGRPAPTTGEVPQDERVRRRYSPGDCPVRRLNARPKFAGSP